MQQFAVPKGGKILKIMEMQRLNICENIYRTKMAYQVVRRFFRAIQFQALFRDWMKCLHMPKEGNTIAIDGKSSWHSYDGMLHMISAYATEARLVLGQEKVSEKSNEITAIPRLLEWLK